MAVGHQKSRFGPPLAPAGRGAATRLRSLRYELPKRSNAPPTLAPNLLLLGRKGQAQGCGASIEGAVRVRKREKRDAPVQLTPSAPLTSDAVEVHQWLPGFYSSSRAIFHPRHSRLNPPRTSATSSGFWQWRF